MQVRDVMNGSPVTIDPAESAALAARLLSRHNIGALPVCGANGKLQGMVTDRDILLRCVAPEEDPKTTPVKAIMTRWPKSLSPADDLRRAAHVMATQQVRRLPVVDQGKLVGMVSLADLVRSGKCEMEVSRALAEISGHVKRG